MDEAAPLLSEVATPRTARVRRLGDFLASTVSGIALVLVLVALVATTPSQWADAVRNVGGSSSASAMFADSKLGNSTRAADTLANLGAARRHGHHHRHHHHHHHHRHEMPGTDAFGERDAGMMDGSGQWLAQLEERAERQKRWQERITLRQTERDRANGRPAPGTPSDDMLPDAFAVHRAAKEAEWSEEIATLGLGRDRSRCLGPEHKVSLFCSLTVCPH
jgi:hypothetical protein